MDVLAPTFHNPPAPPLPLVLGQADTAMIVIVIALAGLAIALLVRLATVSRGVQAVRRAADRLAQGNLTQRVPVEGPRHVAKLAETLNRMAQQLEDRISAVAQQRNELGAVLTAMAEGVLVIDLEEHIISLNRAAADLLGLDVRVAIGRSIQEAIRNAALQDLIAETLRENRSARGEMTLRPVAKPAGTAAGTPAPAGVSGGGDEDRLLELQSAIVRDAGGRRLGAVVVLHDVTHLRRLESVRRDFVANVSHEIKTPISAIRAAVETLLDDRGHTPEDAQRFLQMVFRQANRLDAIVNDLLSLARIEQGAEHIAAELVPAAVAPVLKAAQETCQSGADAKGIEVQLDCDAKLRAKIDAPLLEQAVVNLVDNAVKYSPPDTRVRIDAQARDGEIVIAVTDQGRGIEAEHLPRVFERFYRTDKARSRAVGGTGLGLAIVKHVAEAHGGHVSVDSTPGRGSTFRIHLPARDPATPRTPPAA